MKMSNDKKVYWMSPLGYRDDFGVIYGNVVIDGKTKQGTWSNMTALSWTDHGVGRLGTGYGQMYKKQPDGWIKIEG
jgi:hypothetical protein